MLKIDELNNLEYDEEEVRKKLVEYFSIMEDLTDEEMKKRVDMGMDVFNLVMLFFFLVNGTAATNQMQDIDYYNEMLNRRFSTIFGSYANMDDYLIGYVNTMSLELVNSTIDNIDDDYYTSDERALNYAENEPNTALNYEKYIQAVRDGKTSKQWITEGDNKVRKTHKTVNSKTIGINELFLVGTSYMRFPHDTAYGANPKEYINCRCNVKYLLDDK